MRLRVAVAVAAAVMSATVPARADVAAPPVARHVHSLPTVGPLFLDVLGLGPGLGLPHYCSASVLHSPSGNLAVTAAHCVYGSGAGIEFAPGYSGRDTPYGVWSVRRVYLPPAWVDHRDPRRDVAVLLLASHAGRNVEDVTGPAPRLGSAPEPNSVVTVAGYVAGSGGTPIRCTNSVYLTHGYPSFDCGGFADGVSGGPWTAQGRLVGVIGGLHQGGCTPDTSYSAPFGPAVVRLVARAKAAGPADRAPIAGAAGC